MKGKKWLSLALAGMLAVSALAGCGSSSSSTGSADTASTSTGSADYDLYIFNNKGENADAMAAAAEAFGKEKGVKVKAFSLGSGVNSDDTLRTEMNSKNKPAIFSCMNAETLVEWTEGGFAMDLSKATNEEFKQLVADIPESFNLTDGTANYGIPYNVEGYGYIVDKEMLAALFGEDQVDAFLEAFKTATYDEFEQMVLTLQSYIKEGSRKRYLKRSGIRTGSREDRQGSYSGRCILCSRLRKMNVW